MEQSEYEPVFGRFLSKNLAGVAIPVNADIPTDEQAGQIVDYLVAIRGTGEPTSQPVKQ